ncbi:MAG: hypothetical protein JNK85_28035 [Verrucomicrobiales bacterium]|nr:hypothetical protein [Verrucomicrobiales bacterium]
MASGSDSAVYRTQTLSLHQGWNAVFLEVHPTDAEPAKVFAGIPVDIVATFQARPASAQFVSNPSVDQFRQEGWGVWYAADRPDGFLSTLFAVHGHQAYLVHAKEAFTGRIRGAVVLSEVRWQPGAFNLVGFSVNATAPPTFAEYFRGSKAHTHNRIYRLVEGSWQRLTDPSNEAMRSGEAFWIYCDGPSTYQGPLRVETLTRRGLVLGAAEAEVILRNETGHPLSPKLEHLPVEGDPVPLSIVVQGVRDPVSPVKRLVSRKPSGPWLQQMPALEADRSVRIPFHARIEEMQAFCQSSLLRISTDLGTESWVPVIGIREDLEEK